MGFRIQSVHLFVNFDRIITLRDKRKSACYYESRYFATVSFAKIFTLRDKRKSACYYESRYFATVSFAKI